MTPPDFHLPYPMSILSPAEDDGPWVVECGDHGELDESDTWLDAVKTAVDHYLAKHTLTEQPNGETS